MAAADAVDLTAIAGEVVGRLGAAPCAAVGAAALHAGRWRFGFGAAGSLWPASVGSGAPAAGLDTVFDLASLTKPATALCLARMQQAGVLSRQEPLAAFAGALLSGIEGSASAAVSLDLLTAHRAGLLAHHPFFEPLTRGVAVDPGEALRAAADLRRQECAGPPPPGGFPPLYSDLGYLLAGAALEARAGQALDALMAREVVASLPTAGASAPIALGSARALRAAGVDPVHIAPTEVVGWRGGLVHGVVHDENAWLVAGQGAAGHAGLFGTIGAVVALGALVLDAIAGRTGWLSPAEMEPLVRPRPGGGYAAGFDARPEHFPPGKGRGGAFGHLGFTGTSLWLDPAHGLCAALLTNRVCPTREHLAIRQARPFARDAIARAMGITL